MRLPKRKKDWFGWTLLATAPVANGNFVAPKGSAWWIEGTAPGRAYLRGPACECCRIAPRLTVRTGKGARVISSFAVIGPPPIPGGGDVQ